MPKRKWSKEQRRRISQGVKRAYREGRMIPPSTRPEVAAKISAAKKLHNPSRDDPKVRAKISKTLKRKYKSGELRYTPPSPEGRQRIIAANQKPQRSETKLKISATVKKRWVEGRYKSRNLPTFSNTPTPSELAVLPGLTKLGFIFRHKFPIPCKNQQGGLTYYEADFVHLPSKICVEIDGGDHKSVPKIRERDKRKTKYLNKLKFRVLRFTNKEVCANPKTVIKIIAGYLHIYS